MTSWIPPGSSLDRGTLDAVPEATSSCSQRIPNSAGPSSGPPRKRMPGMVMPVRSRSRSRSSGISLLNSTHSGPVDSGTRSSPSRTETGFSKGKVVTLSMSVRSMRNTVSRLAEPASTVARATTSGGAPGSSRSAAIASLNAQ